MKRYAFIPIVISIISFLLVTWLPCKADDSVINACYKKKNGQLRLVSDPSQCLKSELPISWGGAVEPQPSGVLPVGESCWQMQFLSENAWTGILRLQVAKIAGEHYLMSGKAYSMDPPLETIIHGNAELINGDLRMTLIHSNSDIDWATHETYDVVLNPTTLNGSFKAVGVSAKEGEAWTEQEYLSGTLTSMQCP
ncbi:MAG: hypothetical protein L6290_09520 [Thermodesulfovibrionales bacterium]|nr:hypothetical protein [Thermodesulfovibrionales bacterium]